jgi:hypothetical protein
MRVRGLSSFFIVLGIAVSVASVGRTGNVTASLESTVDDSASGPSSRELSIAGPHDISTEAGIRRLARAAYVWGWPMVYVHTCRKGLEFVPAPARSGGMPVAPINELCMLSDYISPQQTVVPCPNQDVVYGFGIFDLAREPVVLQVPDFGRRFWVYQLGDQRTDGFARAGSMYGTLPGAYLVVGPDWRGEAPAGIQGVFRSPTRFAYCLPRVFLEDTADDRRAIAPALSRIMAYPLSRYDGTQKTTDWNKVRWLPQLVAGGGKKNRFVKAGKFFDDLETVLGDVPPLAGEEPFYDALRRLLAQAKKNPRLGELLAEVAAQTEAEVVTPLFDFRNLGMSAAHHWTTIENGAAFGTDYLTRTAVARSNVFVNREEETKYFYQDFDADGLPLDGSKSYRVTFPAGALPPTSGFWSLTLYDENHALYRNSLDRYSFGTKNRRLRFNDDGSLTIVVQSWAPFAGEQANWLPAPSGKFSLYLRAYGPQQAVLSGGWQPPPVVASRERPDIGD